MFLSSLFITQQSKQPQLDIYKYKMDVAFQKKKN